MSSLIMSSLIMDTLLAVLQWLMLVLLCLFVCLFDCISACLTCMLSNSKQFDVGVLGDFSCLKSYKSSTRNSDEHSCNL